MKTILTLLLACLSLTAATTYPVITDNSNRQFTGGATNLALLSATNRFTGPLQLPGITAARVPIIDAGGNLTNSAVTPTTLGYLDVASSVQALLDTKPTVALTNVSLLNASQTFTGTNEFNVSPTFHGFRIVRSVFLLATNLAVTVTAGTNATQPTNAGDYVLCGAVGAFTVPALPSSWTNVGFNFKVTAQKTAVGNGQSFFHIYGGTATNWLGLGQALGNGANNYFSVNNSGAYTFINIGHHTNQIANAASSTIISGNTPANLIDTSAPWTLYVGYSTAGTTTTLDVKRVVIEAINLD